jgi:hypothetical protein
MITDNGRYRLAVLAAAGAMGVAVSGYGSPTTRISTSPVSIAPSRD